GSADLKRLDILLDLLLDRWPQRARYIHPRRRGALLSLVFESAPHNGRRQCRRIGRRVRDNEILASRLADDPRVRPILVDIFTYRLPDVLEDASRPGEVDAREVGVVKNHLPGF